MRGGKREGAGRPEGKEKEYKILGYRYTEEEYNIINDTLEKLKKEHKTTSKAILELCKFYQKEKGE